MKIISYNVNGIRSALSKGWLNWLQATDADVVCLQEIKATPDQLVDLVLIEQMGYKHYWFPAQKKGYSGTAILTRIEPKHVEYGCGIELYDFEGRNIRVDFEDVSVMSVYFPSGSSGDIRQDFKYKFLDEFGEYLRQLRSKVSSLVICGDYNICHKPIDIHNPKSNANSSGFYPLKGNGWKVLSTPALSTPSGIFTKEPHNYTWWSFRANSRAKNLGWRIDYAMATADLEPRLKRAAILPDAIHSDHCPVLLELA